MIVDYYFRYFDVIELKFIIILVVVSVMKVIFSCYGILMKLCFDNGFLFNL